MRKIRDNIYSNAAIEAMIDSFNEQEEPMVGPFWYDQNMNNVFDKVIALAKDVAYKKSILFNKEVKTCSIKEMAVHHKANDIDYTQRPRGRVFEFKNEGFKVFVGEWINKYPEAKEEILFEFQLPKDKTEFVIDEHWDIGHGWSQEF